MRRFKQAFLILLVVFLGAVATQFSVNALDTWAWNLVEVRWSSAFIFWDSVAVAVVAYGFAWLIPWNHSWGIGSKPKRTEEDD